MDKSINIDYLLLAELKNGNEKAFAQIFDKYHRLLYALAYRYLKSEGEAEDAVQYTFMKIWEQRESFDFQTGIRSLLFTILKNYVLNELRHRKIVYEKIYEMSQSEINIEESFSMKFEEKDLKEHLYAAIKKLPTQRRNVCLLKIEDKLTNQEIADKMNISIPTVKSHYTQAIKTLRKILSRLITLFILSLLFFS